jgi:hypothetical protein
MFYPQSNFYPQSFNPLVSAGQTPFANTLFGFPQQSPYAQQSPSYSQQSQQPPFGQGQGQSQFGQGPSQFGQGQQFGAQNFGAQNFPGAGAASGYSNGAVGPVSGLQQQAPLQQPYHQLLQQLAQYHHLIAQQLLQVAAQQAHAIGGGAYGGQLMPGQVGTSFQPGSNYLPGGTMH